MESRVSTSKPYKMRWLPGVSKKGGLKRGSGTDWGLFAMLRKTPLPFDYCFIAHCPLTKLQATGMACVRILTVNSGLVVWWERKYHGDEEVQAMEVMEWEERQGDRQREWMGSAVKMRTRHSVSLRALPTNSAAEHSEAVQQTLCSKLSNSSRITLIVSLYIVLH